MQIYGMNLSIFKQFLLFMVLSVYGCRDITPSVYTLKLPQPPEAWTLLLGEPDWRLEYTTTSGEWKSVDFPANGKITVNLPKNWTNVVIAWPFWPIHNIIPGFFRPAGALFPFDADNDTLTLSWEAGIDAIFYKELDLAKDNKASKIPANFNWPEFRELFISQSLNIEVCSDPWVVDWRTVAEKTITSNFDRRRIIPENCSNLTIPVPGGFWRCSSPFAEPLFFAEDETPVFPVRPGVNVWISDTGILRINGKTWVFKEYEK